MRLCCFDFSGKNYFTANSANGIQGSMRPCLINFCGAAKVHHLSTLSKEVDGERLAWFWLTTTKTAPCPAFQWLLKFLLLLFGHYVLHRLLYFFLSESRLLRLNTGWIYWSKCEGHHGNMHSFTVLCKAMPQLLSYLEFVGVQGWVGVFGQVLQIVWDVMFGGV